MVWQRISAAYRSVSAVNRPISVGRACRSLKDMFLRNAAAKTGCISVQKDKRHQAPGSTMSRFTGR